MKKPVILTILVFLLSVSTFVVQAGPTEKGSSLIGGGFIYNNSSGDLYGSEEKTTIQANLNYNYFIAKGIGIGVKLTYAHEKWGDNPTYDFFSLGPAINYFIPVSEDKTMPYFGMAYTFDNRFIGSNSSTGGRLILGAGVALLLKAHISVYNEFSYNIEFLEGEKGSTFSFQIGLMGFIY